MREITVKTEIPLMMAISPTRRLTSGDHAMKKLALVALMVFFARPAFAQDIEAMARWTAANIVHYKVVGEFSGEIELFQAEGGWIRRAQVTDRIEVEFDWNQQEFQIVGKPVIRNFPTKLGSINPERICALPKVNGTFELVTGLTLSTPSDDNLRMGGFLNLQAKRDYPAGEVPTPVDDNTENCSKWVPVPAKSETVSMGVQAIPGMLLAVGTVGAQGGMNLSADKKSIVMPPGRKGASNEGWTWTYTPTIVK